MINRNIMEKYCLECGETLRGRSDKKFCSDQCRTSYNNQLKQPTNCLVKKINYTLSRNRRILSNLNPNGKTKIHRKTLMDMGFNFHYYTHVYKTKNGNTYYFCFEQGYLSIDDGFLALVVNNHFYGDRIA
jgi:predicted nucleic acid-binding Zn ribbon protein